MRHLKIKTIKDRWATTSPFGVDMTTWILEENLDLETILFVPLCICIWFFVQSEWVSSSWSGEMMIQQTTGRSAEDKECSADEAAKDFGGGNSEVAFPAMKMSSEIWWWKKPWTSVFFLVVAGKHVHFFSLKENMWKNPSTFFSPFFFLSLNEVVGKTCHAPTKKGSPNVSVNFGCDFRWGKPHIISTPSFLVDIFWGWWKIPSHFVCVHPSWKIWVYLPSAGKVSLWRVCGGCFGPFITQSFDGVFDGQYFSLSPELDELKDNFGSCSELCCSFCLFPEQRPYFTSI